MRKEHVIKLVLIGILLVIIYKFGIMFFLSNDPRNSGWANGKISKEKNQYDLIVVGEDPEGIAAAVSSARMGAKTLLISYGEDLGGIVSKSLIGSLDANLESNGGLLNKGIFADFYNKLGTSFSIQEYKAFVSSLVKTEKRKLDCIYNAKVISANLDGNTIIGVVLKTGEEEKKFSGKRFIDATRDGEILNLCGVPRFTGSEDLNMKNSFLPMELNFLIKCKSEVELRKAVSSFNRIDKFLIDTYETSNVKIRFKDMQFIDQKDGTAVVKGMEITGVDVTDQKALDRAYIEAKAEAFDVVNYFKLASKNQTNIEFVKIADSFYIKEKFHYAGLHTLSVNEILDNTNFEDKIAYGSNPIMASKFDNYNNDIIGKPVQYSIPLRCLIPLKINNLLMIGSKISYSSLAASSAGSIDINIDTGEAGGVAAVFSIAKNISFIELTDQNNTDKMQEYQNLLRKQKLFLSDFKVDDVNSTNFSFTYLKQLRNLGLISAGIDNDYGYSMNATEEDLAILLLNGVYRSSAEKYNLELDNRIRKFFTKGVLTKNKAAEILSALYGVIIEPKMAYSEAIKRGFINDDMQMRLNASNQLKMEDVYALAGYNLKLFTCKELSAD